MALDERNHNGLSDKQIYKCTTIWEALCEGRDKFDLDTSEAHKSGSKTRYNETYRKVILGANVYPGHSSTANSRLSVLACLAHELSHAERHKRGYNRPFEMPDVLLDEAETSIDASFHVIISLRDKEDLVEDAKERLVLWLEDLRNKE